MIASPALLELVRKSRLYGLRLARAIRAQDDHEQVTAWVEVEPGEGGEGCTIGLSNWQAEPLPDADGAEAAERRARHRPPAGRAVGAARRRGRSCSRSTPRRAELAAAGSSGCATGSARPWTEFVELDGNAHEQPLHWRLLDGARLRLDGSARHWKAHLVPLGQPEPGSAGFELHLVADEPLEEPARRPRAERPAADVQHRHRPRDRAGAAPADRADHRQCRDHPHPARRAAGRGIQQLRRRHRRPPGEHLLALIDDLADLEVVEDEQFATAPDRIDLADVARRAAGILGVRAQERGIAHRRAQARRERCPRSASSAACCRSCSTCSATRSAIRPRDRQVWLRVEQRRRPRADRRRRPGRGPDATSSRRGCSRSSSGSAAAATAARASASTSRAAWRGRWTAS